MKPAALLLPVGLLLSCSSKTIEPLPPRGQIVLYFTTNAPLPAPPEETPAADDPPALFDFLHVDVYGPGSVAPCDDCSNEWELDRAKIREASIGVVPAPGVTGYVARAQLYRRISLKDGVPRPAETIDVHAALPAVESDGIVEATIVLAVEDVGRPLGTLAEPVEVRPGKPDISESVWEPARRTACAGAAGPGEICVPGGAFWMGHPYAPVYEDGTAGGDSRLVAVSPLYVDATEVTVGAYRAANLATIEAGTSIDPLAGPGPDAPAPLQYDYLHFCTYSDAPLVGAASREDRPINCVSWHAASEYCASQGKALPSEAEYEFLASGLRSDLFVWGGEQAHCGDAVWGRGSVGFDQCLKPGDPGGPLAAGKGERDRLTLAGGEVLDLAGNVSEWTRDTWNRIYEPCWSGKPLLIDPECSTPSPIDGDARTIKGGPWNVFIPPASFRIGRTPDVTVRAQTGFRCVRHAG